MIRSTAAAAMALPAMFMLRNASVAPPPRLLPFQGCLTNAGGSPVPDGAKVVQFKVYDAPTGGNAVWNGEVQKLTVNGGLVSTLLGCKFSLSAGDPAHNPRLFRRYFFSLSAVTPINACVNYITQY